MIAHAIPSMYSSYDICRAINSGKRDFDLPYFYDLNLVIPYAGKVVKIIGGIKDGITDIETFKHLS